MFVKKDLKARIALYLLKNSALKTALNPMVSAEKDVYMIRFSKKNLVKFIMDLIVHRLMVAYSDLGILLSNTMLNLLNCAVNDTSFVFYQSEIIKDLDLCYRM